MSSVPFSLAIEIPNRFAAFHDNRLLEAVGTDADRQLRKNPVDFLSDLLCEMGVPPLLA